jgi:uncharacterized protein
MGAIANEPSMEEILSSIKRIIAEEDGGAAANRASRRRSAPRLAEAGDDDAVLELTEAVPQEAPASLAPVPRIPLRPAATAPTPAADDAPVISLASVGAARESLANLSSAISQREATANGSQTIDALVRELLAPMLKEWLDKNLPVMVEQMVQREIDRITAGLR